MASFCIVVTHPPFDSCIAHSALKFTQAACEAGHQVNGVFFYQAGVIGANSYVQLAADEVNLYQQWCRLHSKHAVPLWTCITAANRRGVLSVEEADEQRGQSANLHEPFSAAGLGELVSLISNADRVVQF